MRMWMVLLVLLGWASLTSAAEIYKWVDEQGRVHFGQRPPAKGPAQQVEVRDKPLSNTPFDEEMARREREQNLLRAFEEERAQKKAAKQRSSEEQAKRERNCAVARDRLRRYEGAGALYDLDEKGNRRILSDRERTGTEQRARDDVKKWCD